MNGLIQGRTVHYVYAEDDLEPGFKKLAGTTIAATVVNPAPEVGLPEGTVNLTGWTDGPNHGLGLVIRLEKRPYSPHGDPGTWHWPQDEIIPKPVLAESAEPTEAPEPVEPPAVTPVVEPVAPTEPVASPAPTPTPEQPPAVTPAT